jgi:cyclopropane fatty-acyl-phospholipid synthase-like methyltransferase
MKNLNSSIDQSIIKSLDGTDKELLPFIPFLLQDLWEIGSSPEIINQLLLNHNCVDKQSKVLDLGCGKGAISVNMAKQFGCQVLGIDAMPKFIEEANYWSDKFHQSHLCTFEVDDIRQKTSELINFELIVLGSIGPVFGNIEITLNSVKSSLVANGYVILDDGYIPEDGDFKMKIILN